MKFLAILEKPASVSASDFASYVQPEAEQVWKLYQEQKIIELYFVEGEMMPLIVIVADSPDEAQEVLQSLPMVKDQLFEARLLQLTPYDELGQRLKQAGQSRPDWWPTNHF